MICAKCNKKMRVKDCYNQNCRTYRVYKCPVCGKIMYTMEAEADKSDIQHALNVRNYNYKRSKV